MLEPCIEVVGLSIKPIKSCGIIDVQEAHVADRGLMVGQVRDRQWMLVDKNNVHVTQRELDKGRNKLARVHIEIDTDFPDQIIVSAKGMGWNVIISPSAVTDTAITAFMHKDDDGVREKVPVHVMGGSGAAWFQQYLGDDGLKLVYQKDEDVRYCNENFALHPFANRMSLGDGYPALLTTGPTLRQAEQGIGKPKPKNRFRENIFIDGDLKPNEENGFAFIQCGDVILAGVKPCTRCPMTGVDQATGEYEGSEVLKWLGHNKLVDYRHRNARVHGAVFGENLIPVTYGPIRVGDKVRVMSRKPAPEFIVK